METKSVTLDDLIGMRALSLMQPWASALFLGLKHYETRSWPTRYRGPLLIHAAKGFPIYALDFANTCGHIKSDLPLGAIIGLVQLVDVQPTFPLSQDLTALECLYGDYTPGRWAWKLADPVLFAEPIPYRGALGIRRVKAPC